MDQKIKKYLLASLPFLFILIFWQTSHYYSIFPKWLIPPPLEVASTFSQLIIDGTLIELILISAKNLLPAYFLALICAVGLGTIIGVNSTCRRIFSPFLSAIYPIPSLAWLPFIILFLGFTRETIWFVIFISSFMKIIYNVISGVRHVNINWILMAKNLGFTKLEIILRVILPGAFPQIITGLRLGFGSAWRSLIGAEMLVMTLGGLGKFIWMSQWFFNFDKVIIGIAVLAIIGILIEGVIFRVIERYTLIRWGIIGEKNI